MSRYYLIIGIRDKDNPKFSEDCEIEFIWNNLKDIQKWVIALSLIVKNLITQKLLEK